MIKNFLIKLIRFYQKIAFFRHPILKSLFLSDASCRFLPTCPEYCWRAIEKYGAVRGSILCLKRIIRCHPLTRGGEDPVK